MNIEINYIYPCQLLMESEFESLSDSEYYILKICYTQVLNGSQTIALYNNTLKIFSQILSNILYEKNGKSLILKKSP